MDLHIKPTPSEDGITRIVTLSQNDLTQKKLHREIADLSSFVDYLNRWGDADKGTVYWTPTGTVALLDEQDLQTGRGDQDTVAFDFARPLVAKRWLGAIGNTFSHKKFKDFLELRHGEIQNGPGFYTKIANLSLAQTFTYDGKLDSDQAYSIAFKSDAGADVALLPKHIEVHIPLIEGLETPFRLQLRLKFVAPTSADDSPTFTLLWDDKDDVLEEAARAAIEAIKAGLPGWLVVHGQPKVRSST